MAGSETLRAGGYHYTTMRIIGKDRGGDYMTITIRQHNVNPPRCGQRIGDVSLTLPLCVVHIHTLRVDNLQCRFNAYIKTSVWVEVWFTMANVHTLLIACTAPSQELAISMQSIGTPSY